MLPIHFKPGENTLSTYKELFAKTLCDGYKFDVKSDIEKNGTRFVYYCKSEHSLLVSHTLSNRVHLIDLSSGKLKFFDHHGTSVRCILTCKNKIITGSWDGTLCITDFDTLKVHRILTEKSMGRCPHIEISPDARFVYSYSYDSDKNPGCTSNTIRVWSIESGDLENVIHLPGDHLGIRKCGSCIRVNNQIYSVSNSGYFQVFDCYSGKLLSECFLYDELESLCSIPSHDSIIIGGTSGRIYKYSTSEHKITQSVQGHRHDVTQLMASGERPEVFFSVSFDGTVKAWSVPDLKLVASINVFRNSLWSLSLVNDFIVTGGNEGEIWIYDMKDLNDIILKGKIIVFHQSFAYIPVDSNSFYADNPSTMQVIRKDNNEPLSDHYGEYLLNSYNNFKVFHDLFNTGPFDAASFNNDTKIMFQIPQTFK
jgi:WD40 repeat protein